MTKAEKILFDKVHDNQAFFENKTDLATSLVSNKNSAYYTSPDETLKYAKSLNRVKAYISQLFSPVTTRVVTNEFIDSIKTILNDKKKFTPEYINLTLEEARRLLIDNNHLASNRKELNSRLEKRPSQEIITQNLLEEVESAKYILLIASRPYEYLNSPYTRESKIFEILIAKLATTFIESLPSNRNNVSKSQLPKCSINVPNKRIALRFWNELSDILMERLDSETRKILDYNIKTMNYGSDDSYLYSTTKTTSIETFTENSDIILNYLDNNLLLQIYENEMPIYSIPMIIINPNYNPTSAYYLVSGNKTDSLVYNLDDKGVESWKEHVWDIVKSNSKGKRVTFLESQKK
jgi:hypothetical protein